MVWCPNTGVVCNLHIKPKPKTAFVITDYKEDKDPELLEVEKEMQRILRSKGFKVEYARDIKRGKSILCKICEAMQAVGLGIVLYSNKSPRKSIPNIFFEASFMYAMGKEVVMIGHRVKRPSDLDGIEWIHVTDKKSIHAQLPERIIAVKDMTEYYLSVGELLERTEKYSDAADYYIKAALINHSKDAVAKLGNLSVQINKKELPGHKVLTDHIDSFISLLPKR